KAKVNEIGCGGQKLERRKIPFVQRTGIGPDPADPVFFQEPDVLGSMPAGIAEFDREPEIARQLGEESAQQRAAGFWRERWRQLNEDDVEFWGERLERAEERGQLRLAVAQMAFVGDFPRKFAGEPERSRRGFGPAADGRVGRRLVEGR